MALTSSSSSASSTHLLHHLFRHPQPPPVTVNSYLFLRPSRFVSTKTQKPYFLPKPLLRNPPQSFPFFTSSSSPSISSSGSISSSASESVSDSALYVEEEEDEEQELADDDLSSLHEEEEEEEEEEEGSFSALLEEDDDEEDEIEEEKGDESDKSLRKSLHDSENESFDEGIEESKGFYVDNSSNVSLSGKNEKSTKPLPSLTIKEKKELASYAHSLGKKLKCQLVGKSGVTDTVVFSFDETLEKNELMKIKVLRNCPDELEDVVRYLEKATGSVVVGEIGRTVILYRPSVTKLKAEEKRKESQRLFLKRTSRFRPGPPGYQRRESREYETRTAGRGRRGVSRVRNDSY